MASDVSSLTDRDLVDIYSTLFAVRGVAISDDAPKQMMPVHDLFAAMFLDCADRLGDEGIYLLPDVWESGAEPQLAKMPELVD